MKTFSLERDEDGMVVDKYVFCDFKDSPEDVAVALNRLLALHGLEIVKHEDGESDEYAFSVQKA